MTFLAPNRTDISGISSGAILATLKGEAALDAAIDSLTVSLAPFAAAAPLPSGAANTSQDDPLSFPSQLAATYTARLRALMPIFISQLYVIFAGGTVPRGAISRLREVRRALLALYRAEKQNFTQAIISAVRANPVWQTRIIADLGGDAALQKWEARSAKLQTAPQSPNNRPSVAPTRAVSPARRHCKSPRKTAGLFRLAPLTQPRKAKTPAVSSAGQFFPSIAIAFTNPRAIALTPSDLRARNCSIQPPSPLHLFKMWAKMQDEHMGWGYRLIIADMMTVSAKVRADFAPP